MKSQKHFKINNNNKVVISNCKYDEDEDTCRICRNPGDSDNPLKYPCACSGSIKFVHQDCLLRWLNFSNASQCEVRLRGHDAAREDEDPVPFDDFVGMQLSPVFHSVEFAFTVIASNMKIVSAVIFLPFTIGRIILHLLCWFSTTTATPMFLVFSIAGLSVVTNSSSETAGKDGLHSQAVEVVPETLTTTTTTGLDIVSYCVGKPLADSSSRLSDVTILATGYMLIVSMVFFYLGIVAMVKLCQRRGFDCAETLWHNLYSRYSRCN
ncbi:hypothetical protein MKX01_042500 [Papaver californicum]|nr:hypothetical protein MKX01_042500 [Papaver californicum]